MATTFNFNDFMNQKQAPVVLPGKYENVVISNYEVQTSNNSTYVRFTFKLKDGRTISDNRFQQGLGIMFSHLREQLKLQSQEMSPAELFEMCKTKYFTLWVEKATILNSNTGLPQRVTNIHFLEPLNTISEVKPEEGTTETIEQITNDEMPE
jgi:hypothetical protein